MDILLDCLLKIEMDNYFKYMEKMFYSQSTTKLLKKKSTTNEV